MMKPRTWHLDCDMSAGRVPLWGRSPASFPSPEDRSPGRTLPGGSIRRAFSLRLVLSALGARRQHRVFWPIVFGIAASHIAPRVGPGATPEARDIGGQRDR